MLLCFIPARKRYPRFSEALQEKKEWGQFPLTRDNLIYAVRLQLSSIIFSSDIFLPVPIFISQVINDHCKCRRSALKIILPDKRDTSNNNLFRRHNNFLPCC
jgi:hypothetical protein